MEAFETCYVGGIHIEKRLNELLIEDNTDLIDKYPTVRDSKSFSGNTLEDLKGIYYTFFIYIFFSKIISCNE